jgi:dTDP-4-amino-4,6-dideoxygalactose transaminase
MSTTTPRPGLDTPPGRTAPDRTAPDRTAPPSGAVAPVIDHPPEWPVYDEDAVARATALVRAGRTFDYRHGPELAGLEGLFSAQLDDRHVIALNSGTSALFAAYYALGLAPGDEVVMPTLTFLATASPLFLLGAVPVLCDAGADNGNVTAATLRERVTERTRAIAVTHLFGHPCPMDEIAALATEYRLPLVEDCSHAHGSTYRGRPVGTFGDLAVFSTGGVKLVSGGMGGVLACRSRHHYELACLLSSFKQRSELTVRDPRLRPLADVGLGGNLRISPVAAVLAASHLRRLPELTAAKRHNASRLLAGLCRHPGVAALPVSPEVDMGAWYDVVVAVDPGRAGFSRDDLLAALRAEGVRARVTHTAPLHLTSVFQGHTPDAWRLYPPEVLAAGFRYRRGDLPRAEALHDRWLSLPATYLNEPGCRLVGPYLAAFDRVLDRLSGSGR